MLWGQTQGFSEMNIIYLDDQKICVGFVVGAYILRRASSSKGVFARNFAYNNWEQSGFFSDINKL